MLKARIITAIFLIPIVIACIFLLPPLSFFSLAMLLMLLAGWEWAQLSGLVATTSKIFYLVVLAVVLTLSVFVPIYLVILIGIVWWLLALILLILYPKASSWWGNSKLIRCVMGILVLTPCWIGLITLQGFSPEVLLYCLVLVWAVDSAAYFVGKKWGKHKITPAVSPGKSYEGLIGALLAAIIISAIGGWVFALSKEQWTAFLFICLLGGVFVSLFGDLFESMLKRQSNVKDSGTLLPGHGGILDRIDSLITTIPFFALIFPFFFNG
jgi:phosphatidate cytidylyltransferase